MAVSVATPPDQSNLEKYLGEIFDHYSVNRRTLEEKWQRNRDAFSGIFQASGMKSGEGAGWRSRTTINVTKQKAMTFYAVVLDTILAGGRLPFTLTLFRQAVPEEEAPLFESQLSDTDEKMTRQIEDARSDREFMRGVLSLGVYGEGWLKLLVSDVKRRTFNESNYMAGLPPSMRRFMPQTTIEQVPAWTMLSVWNMFFDIEAIDVEDMDIIFHRSYVCPYDLRKMESLPGFDKKQIRRVIKEAEKQGGTTAGNMDETSSEPRMRDIAHRYRTIELRESWGRVPRKALENHRAKMAGELGETFPTLEGEEQEGDEVYGLFLQANGRVIREMPVSPSDCPFLRCKAEEDIDSAHGIGTADNAEQSARMMNWAIRAFEDNKRLSGNVQLAGKREYLEGEWNGPSPGGFIQLTADCDDVSKAIQNIVIHDVGQTLLPVIELAARFADEDTMIPKVTQGLPDTVSKNTTAYEISTRTEKAQKYMGSIVRNIDENWIEPGIGWMLDYNLSDPAFGPGGPFVVNANGFSSFQNKVERAASIERLIGILLQSPDLAAVFHLDELGREMAGMLDMDPDRFVKRGDEPPPPDPMQEAAMASEQAKTEKTMAEARHKDADSQKVAAEAQKLEVEAELLARGDNREEGQQEFDNELALVGVAAEEDERMAARMQAAEELAIRRQELKIKAKSSGNGGK